MFASIYAVFVTPYHGHPRFKIIADQFSSTNNKMCGVQVRKRKIWLSITLHFESLKLQYCCYNKLAVSLHLDSQQIKNCLTPEKILFSFL